MRSLIFLLLIISSDLSNASIVIYDDTSQVGEYITSKMIIEDWSSYPIGTELENQNLEGITYSSTGSSVERPLIVRSSGFWSLGYRSNDGLRFRSFSGEEISLNFINKVDYFSINLAQGNQSSGVRYEGESIWKITVDDQNFFTVKADYDTDDRYGLAFIGLSNLKQAQKFGIKRISSDAPIVWSINNISYMPASEVPLPAGISLFLSGLVGLGLMRGRNG